MRVDALALEDFRNYRRLEAAFSPGVNVIYGENAQGKTNLLEAVAYLSTASSHRARYDRELIQFGVDHAFVKAEVSARGRDFTLEARLGRGVRRQLYSNGVRLKSAGELSGVLNTVLFCPEDLYLIREGAATRRRFLDGCICQLRPKYAEALAEYRRLYEHKVRILRDWEEHPSLLDTLDEFNLRMAQTGALLIHYRAHFVKRLREVTPPIHLDFSGGREKLGLAPGPSPLKWRETLPYLLFAALLCLLLPFVLRLCDAGDVPVLSGLLYPYLLLPVGTFCSALSLGKRQGFCPLYPVVCAGFLLCFALLARLVSNVADADMFPVAFAAALAGNLAGAALRRRGGAGE